MLGIGRTGARGALPAGLADALVDALASLAAAPENAHVCLPPDEDALVAAPEGGLGGESSLYFMLHWCAAPWARHAAPPRGLRLLSPCGGGAARP